MVAWLSPKDHLQSEGFNVFTGRDTTTKVSQGLDEDKSGIVKGPEKQYTYRCSEPSPLKSTCIYLYACTPHILLPLPTVRVSILCPSLNSSTFSVP